MSEVELCPHCSMAVVDDLHRTNSGTAWHGECHEEWVAAWVIAGRDWAEGDRDGE